MNISGYYINLDSSEARRLDFQKQLDSGELSDFYNRFDATAFDVHVTSKISIPDHTTKSLLGNWLSHLEIMRCHKSADTLLHICEDDAKLPKNFLSYIGNLKFPEQWDIVLLDCFPVKNVASHRQIHECMNVFATSKNISVLSANKLGYNGGMSSYLVNPASIEKLLHLLNPLNSQFAHIDHHLASLIQQGVVEVYTTLPFISSFSEHAENSTLQGKHDALVAHLYTYRKACYIDTFTSIDACDDAFLNYLRVSFDYPEAPLRESSDAFRQELLFSAPLQIFKVPSATTLNVGLFEDVKRWCRQPNDGYRSSYGGRRSYEDIFSDPSPNVQQLLPYVQLCITHYLETHLASMIKLSDEADFDIDVTPWAYYLTQGDFMKPHLHPDGFITGVYYVHVPKGKERDEGALIMMAPDTGRSLLPHPSTVADSVTYRPEEGELIIFPSYVPHYVNPFDSGERAVIAFDIKLNSKKE